MLVLHWCGTTHHAMYRFMRRKNSCESVRHEKKLLILTEIMLIKVWAKREVNNGSPMNAF